MKLNHEEQEEKAGTGGMPVACLSLELRSRADHLSGPGVLSCSAASFLASLSFPCCW